MAPRPALPRPNDRPGPSQRVATGRTDARNRRGAIRQCDLCNIFVRQHTLARGREQIDPGQGCDPRGDCPCARSSSMGSSRSQVTAIAAALGVHRQTVWRALTDLIAGDVIESYAEPLHTLKGSVQASSLRSPERALSDDRPPPPGSTRRSPRPKPPLPGGVARRTTRTPPSPSAAPTMTRTTTRPRGRSTTTGMARVTWVTDTSPPGRCLGLPPTRRRAGRTALLRGASPRIGA